MARLTLNEARRTMSRGRPWTFRLECTTGGRNAFWLCTGRGRNEPVEVHYGGIGNKPQVIVKDWGYVEAKTPEKVAKGYDYVDTKFVRMNPANFGGSPTTPKPAPVTPAAPTPNVWRCDNGKLTVTLNGRHIEIKFDVFPAAWQGAAYHTFKNDLEAFCTTHMGFKVGTWWGGNNSELFHANCNDKGLFDALVLWFQQTIPGLKTPQVPAPALPGPFGSIVTVKSIGGGKYQAFDASGIKVVTMPSASARKLVADHAHITVAGL